MLKSTIHNYFQVHKSCVEKDLVWVQAVHHNHVQKFHLSGDDHIYQNNDIYVFQVLPGTSLTLPWNEIILKLCRDIPSECICKYFKIVIFHSIKYFVVIVKTTMDCKGFIILKRSIALALPCIIDNLRCGTNHLRRMFCSEPIQTFTCLFFKS